MNRTFIEGSVFENQKYQVTRLDIGDYEECTFRNCDLDRAVFRHSNLEHVNFRTSCNFSIDPDLNRISKAKFSLQGLPGLMNKFNIEID